MARLWLAVKDSVVPNPDINGDTGIADPGVAFPGPGESGYTGGARVSWVSGSALPQVILQGVRRTDGDFVSLAFFVRFDRDFSDHDAIVIGFRKNAAGPHDQTQCRRIDIFPLHAGAGAGPTPEPEDSSPDVRTGQPPRTVVYRKGIGTAQWAKITAPTAAGLIAVRSWRPPTPSGWRQERAWSVEAKIPTNAAAGTSVGLDWIDLNTSSFGLYISVIRTIADPVSGLGLFANQFIWPTSSPPLTGTLDPIVQVDNIQIAPGSYGEAVLPTPGAPNPNKGVKFVNGELGIGIRPQAGGALGATIDLTGTNTLTARVMNDSTDASGDASRVTAEFRLANWGLGANTTWTRIITQPGTNPSTPAVDVPHGTASLDLTTNWELTATQRVQYDTDATRHQCLTVHLDAAGSRRNPVLGATNASPIEITTLDPHGLTTGDRVIVTDVAGNSAANNTVTTPEWTVTVTGTSTFTLDGSAGDGDYTSNGFVRRAAVQVVEFAQSSMRRNMDFLDLSDAEREAEISGAGYPEPPQGRADHDFLLLVDARDLTPRRTISRHGARLQGLPEEMAADVAEGEGTVRQVWVWVVHGYRDTGHTLRVSGAEYKIFDPAPGAFGYVAQHDGPATDVLTFDLSGGRLTRHGDGVYTLPVPHNGSVVIHTVVSAGPAPQGCLPGWLARLIEAVRRLLGR
ncbi:hypothetical protein ACWDRB_62190 [Nonomuraea sp. NPDC003707]